MACCKVSPTPWAMRTFTSGTRRRGTCSNSRSLKKPFKYWTNVTCLRKRKRLVSWATLGQIPGDCHGGLLVGTEASLRRRLGSSGAVELCQRPRPPSRESRDPYGRCLDVGLCHVRPQRPVPAGL